MGIKTLKLLINNYPIDLSDYKYDLIGTGFVDIVKNYMPPISHTLSFEGCINSVWDNSNEMARFLLSCYPTETLTLRTLVHMMEFPDIDRQCMNMIFARGLDWTAAQRKNRTRADFFNGLMHQRCERSLGEIL